METEDISEDHKLLLAEAACHRLVQQYGRCIDEYDDDGVLAAFAEDGVWNHMTVGPLRGTEEIREFLAGRDRSVLVRHLMTNFHIELVDDCHATGGSYWTAFLAQDHTPGVVEPTRAPFSIGQYEDEFVCVDGHWLISSRTMIPVFR